MQSCTNCFEISYQYTSSIEVELTSPDDLTKDATAVAVAKASATAKAKAPVALGLSRNRTVQVSRAIKKRSRLAIEGAPATPSPSALQLLSSKGFDSMHANPYFYFHFLFT